MTLDGNAVRNLELLRNNAENKKYGSLLWILDKTKTGMGARLLSRMMLSPLKDKAEINAYRERKPHQQSNLHPAFAHQTQYYS